MLRRTGFGNGDDIAVPDSPGQRDSGCRATMRRANTCKYRLPQQARARTAKRRIGHYGHAVPLAPWQQILLNAAVRKVVEDLVGRTAIAVRHPEELFHVTDVEIGDAPGANLTSR